MMSDGSGPGLPGSLLTFDPDTSSWKTSPDLFGQVLDTSLQTLPGSGSMRNGECYPQPPLVPLTDANESGSWPTPKAHDAKAPRSNTETKRESPDLNDVVSRLDQTTQPDGKPGQPTADLNPQFVAALMGVPKDWLTPYTSEETA